MLDPADLATVTATFGVAEDQVRRDHLIGHVLAALSTLAEDSLVFFGGTALTWTHLPEGRLSEDVDLYCTDRPAVARMIESEVPRLLRREVPGTAWSPGLTAVRSTDPARLVTPDGLVVRLQLLDVERQGWTYFPTERRRLIARYTDLPEISMRVPTLAGFAAMKTVAWTDRRTPRDLFDLAGLASLNALESEAAEIFRRATGRRLAPHDFSGQAPRDWAEALAHQTGRLPSATTCLERALTAYGSSLGWNS